MRRNPPRSVVLFGTSISSAYLSGATMLFRALTHAFLRLTARVTFVEENHPWLGDHTDYAPKDTRLTVRRYFDRVDLIALLGDRCLLADADLILKFSGSSLMHDRFLDEWLVNHVDGKACSFVYVDADAPMRLPYIVGHPKFYLRNLLPIFDGVWVMLGGARAVNEYLSIGARAAWALPAAIDSEQFSLSAEDAQERITRADLLFVGNPAPGRNRAFKEYFLDVAIACPDLDFAVAGAEWENAALPPNVRSFGYVHSERLPELYRSARLTLNVTREEMADYGDAGALRLFEAAACGACIVSDEWPGIERLFVPRDELLIVRQTSDVVALLRATSPATAQAIGERARLRVLRDHTADIRIAQLLSHLAR